MTIDVGQRVRTPPSPGRARLLTARQLEVLYWLSFGLTLDGVARQLGVKPSTVTTLRKTLYRRLDVSNVAEAVRVGFELKLLRARVSDGDDLGHRSGDVNR